MSKVKGYLRRFLACVMICFTLSFTAAGDYLDIQEFQVYATGLEIGMLEALIEAILASMGISLSSQADLSSVAQGLSSVMKQYTDYEVGGVKIFPLISTVISDGMSDAGSWGLPAVCDQWLRTYLYNQCVSNISSACDVSSPIFSSSGVESITCDFSQTSNLIEAGLFYGLWNPEEIYSRVPFYYPDRLSYSPIIITELVPGDGSASLNLYYFYSSSSHSPTSSVAIFDVSDDGVKRYCAFDSSDTSKFFNYRASYGTYNYGTEQLSFPLSVSGSGSRTMKSTLINEQYILLDESSGNQYRIFINSKGLGVYDSLSDYNMYQFSTIYKPKSKVYGLSSTAKPFVKDESTGTVSIPFDSVGITSKVEQAISTAIAANPSITEEELNAAASDVIAAQNGTTEAVNQNTATLSALLTSILATVRGIADSVSKISVDGGAGALDWSDVQDAFGTTTVEPGTSDSDSDNDDDGGKPNVWVPGVVAGVSLLLKPLIEFLGEPLSVVTQFQSAILGQLEGAQEWIMDIPEAISVALNPALTDILEGVLSLPVTGIYEGILALPGDIADALSNGLSIDIPDVVFPDLDIIDYTSLLDRIIELLESFFLLDTAAIAAALGGFEKVWEEKLPFGNKMFSLFNEFYFSPNYNYPVIKVKTPDIIRTFYPEEYIILCDFEEYKVYCLWARNIIKAWLWFCFGLSIFSHLKTNFHIG